MFHNSVNVVNAYRLRRMSGRDEAGVRDFIERMALTWADWGFPRMAARVLMTFLTSDEQALTSAQLTERLEASPAAISGAVRYLMQISMLRRHPLPGSRRHAYSLYDDTWFQVVAKNGFYALLAELTQEGVKATDPDAPSHHRLVEMRDFFAFLDTEMTALIERWHAQRADPA